MYKIEQQEGNDPLFIFNTSNGLTYYVSFQKMEIDSDYFQYLYSVDFGEVNGFKKPKDELIGVTIKYIISNFLNNKKFALLHYVCDSSDGRHYGRSRLFSTWFDVFKENNHSKFVINYKNDEIDYQLEFIFNNLEYKLDELETQVIKQMDRFSEFK